MARGGEAFVLSEIGRSLSPAPAPTLVVTLDGVDKPPIRVRLPTETWGDLAPRRIGDEWRATLKFDHPSRNRTIAEVQRKRGRDAFVLADAAAVGQVAATAYLSARRQGKAESEARTSAIEAAGSEVVGQIQDRIFDADPGPFRDIKQETKDRKDALFGDHYPVLVATGEFVESMSVKGRR